MEEHKIDKNFSGRLNILRAGVLGANDGIISIAGVVIGVASATEDVWIIFLSGLAAVFASAFSMAGGEYTYPSPLRRTLRRLQWLESENSWKRIPILPDSPSTPPTSKMVSARLLPNS